MITDTNHSWLGDLLTPSKHGGQMDRSRLTSTDHDHSSGKFHSKNATLKILTIRNQGNTSALNSKQTTHLFISNTVINCRQWRQQYLIVKRQNAIEAGRWLHWKQNFDIKNRKFVARRNTYNQLATTSLKTYKVYSTSVKVISFLPQGPSAAPQQ